MQMLLQKRIERRTASLLLYALHIQACHRPRQYESNSTKTEASARKHVQGTRREASYKRKPKAKLLSYPERKGVRPVSRGAQ
jgi:hypothetical protein